jgi:carboxypeptidase Taq
MQDRFKKLIVSLKEIGLLSGIGSLLSWDQETYMPSGAIDVRSEQSALMAELVHARWTGDAFRRVLSEWVDLDSGAFLGDVSDEEKRFLSEVYRDWKKAVLLPSSFVSAFSSLTSKAQHVWQEARAASRFSLFQPYLAQVVAMSRERADYLKSTVVGGGDVTPYDVLLNEYEPGVRSSYLTPLFQELCVGIKDILKKVDVTKTVPNWEMDVDRQWEFGMWILAQMGFDFSFGRQDKSTHPFTTQFHPYDVRITTRLDARHFMDGFSSTVHEGGHALYEQGLDPAWFGTPFGEAMSLGIHESQSRMWENQIVKSRAFWEGQFQRLQMLFPHVLGEVSWLEFYHVVNRVRPSFIRVDADEVTYNLHIIIRYELEKAMVDGTLAVADLPHAWNAKYLSYLGISSENESMGVLQDVHWSCGLLGYFPTYTLGNLYAAQFYGQIERDILDVSGLISRAEFSPITSWLRKNIHQVGRRMSPSELVMKVTGESLSSEPFLNYLRGKYLVADS